MPGGGQTSRARKPTFWQMRMPRNSLLAALAPTHGEPHIGGLKRVRLHFGEVLHERGHRIRHVYFPIDALVSLLTNGGKHTAMVVALIGYEGLVGVSVALGEQISPVRALVQGAGMAVRVATPSFVRALARHEGMQRDVNRYSSDLTNLIIRTAACHRNHSIEQRLASWLLMVSDRVSTDRLELTQSFLSGMLGVRRAGVSEAASALQAHALIRYARGHIEIRDRSGLRAVACDCYEPLMMPRRRVTARAA
jgi:CRP-like cAMP-binding protein